MARLGLQGDTTEPIAHAGNIRADMFELLAKADIVIADIFIDSSGGGQSRSAWPARPSSLSTADGDREARPPVLRHQRWLARNWRRRSERGLPKTSLGGPSSSIRPWEEHHAARHLAREADLVGHDQHRVAFLGEIAHPRANQ